MDSGLPEIVFREITSRNFQFKSRVGEDTSHLFGLGPKFYWEGDEQKDSRDK